MKKNWTSIVTVLVCIAVLCMGQSNNARVPMNVDGQSVNPGQTHTAKLGWSRFGGTTASFAVATSSPNATNCTAALFVADTANKLVKVDPRFNRIVFRVSGVTAGDVAVFDVFAMAGETDHLSRIGTLTWTVGTRTSNVTGSEFAHTVTKSNEDGLTKWTVTSPGSNGLAMATIDLLMFDYVGLCPTSLSSATVVEWTGF